MNVKRLAAMVVVSIAISASPSFAKGKRDEPQRVDVPSGINSNLLSKLWKTAKLKCMEMEYAVTNEDKDTRSIFCTHPTEMGNYTILVVFDDTGYTVTTKGVGSSVPFFSSMDSNPRKRKAEMIEALNAAAHI